MAQQQIRNTFEKGQVTDFSKNNIPPNQYLRGVNVTLSKDGQYTALTNLRGNEGLFNIFTDSIQGGLDEYQVLGMYYIDWYYTPTETSVPCIVAFVSSPVDNTYKLYLYDTVSTNLYVILTVDFPASAAQGDHSIDAVIFGENGKNILYFTDGFSEPKKVVCQYPGQVEQAEVNLLKKGAVSPIVISDIATTGGELACGAYQFAYRLINKDNNKYTNYSLLTNPVMVFQEPNDTDSKLAVGDIGTVTTNKITLELNLTQDERDNYDYYQIAVLENLDSLNYPPLSARQLDPVLIQANPNTTEYKSNSSGVLINADDITVEKAAIDSWKTMTVKDNILLAGNIKYKDLSYDNGEPTINGNGGTTAFITHSFTGSDPESTRSLYTQQEDASTKVGYFRDEVYRLYISHFDDDGNFSRPRPIDFTPMGASNPSTSTDLKFPSRSDANYTLLNNSGDLEALGVRIEGIYGHPKWAKGFVVLRAERKKNIVMQSPLVPSILVQPAKASGTYPSTPEAPDDPITTAQPPSNVSGTYMPKNFFHCVNRSLVRPSYSDVVIWEAEGSPGIELTGLTATLNAFNDGINATITSVGANFNTAGFKYGDIVYFSGWSNNENNNSFGRVFNIQADSMSVENIDYEGTYVNETSQSGIGVFYQESVAGSTTGADHVHTIYGPEFMFTDINGQPYQEYNSGVNDKLETVDVAFLKAVYNDYDAENSYDPLDYADTNIFGAFYAVEQNSYYYKRGTTSPTPAVSENGVQIASFDLSLNSTEKTVISSSIGEMVSTDFGDYAGLDAEGLSEGSTPDNMRAGVIVTRKPKQDVTRFCFDGTNGYKTGTDITDQILHFTGINSNFSSSITNDPFDGQTFDSTTYLGAVEIVNVTKGLGDDRYGEPEEAHDVYSTGAIYTFNPSEATLVANGTNVYCNVDVWGGDCNIGLATFKIGNGVYSKTNGADTVIDIQNKWGLSFQNAGTEVARPIPVAGAHQSISVFLESEVNVEVLPRLTYDENTLANGFRIPRPNSTNTGTVRLVQDYSYFPAYSARNINKLFVPYNDFDKNLTKFRSRVAHSDVKIYQSDQEGFDSFKAGNVYDLDETYGELTKLVLAGNDVFGLQNSGVVYLPINASIIETDDLSQLAVRDKEIIGRVKYINTLNGCRDIRTVSTTPSGFIFYDSSNKQLFSLSSGGGTSTLSETGILNVFNNELPDQDLPDRQLFGNYDINEKKYLLTYTEPTQNISRTFVYNERLGLWEGEENYGTEGRLLGSTYGDKEVYHIGIDNESDTNISLGIYKNDAGTMNEWFNHKQPASVKFMINPSPEYAKVYDNLRVYANGPLDTADMLVERLDESERQRAFGMNLDIEPREEYYRLKVLRDEVGRRLRGSVSELTLSWDKDRDEEISLFSVTTKYRASSRIG